MFGILKQLNKKNLQISKHFKATAKIVTAFFVILLLYCECFIGVTTLRKVMKDLYLGVCKDYAYSYAENISTLIDRFNSDLSLFSKMPVGFDDTEATLTEKLRKMSPYLPADFLNVFFADSTGYGYFKDGSSVYVGDRKYYEEIMVQGFDYYIGEPVISKTTGIPVFHLCEAVYSRKGEKMGFYAVAIPLTSITRNIRPNSLVKKGATFIVNSDGKFLLRPDKSIIPLSYTYLEGNASNKKIDMLLEPMTKLFKGMYNLTNSAGESFMIVYTPVEKTAWSLGIAIPLKDINEVPVGMRSRMILIIVIFALLFIFSFVIAGGILLSVRVREIKAQVEGVTDLLTGLNTLKTFEANIDQILEKNKEKDYMLISFDIRGLKYINQAYSEVVGDDILILFGDRLGSYTATLSGECARGYADHFYAFVEVQNKRAALQHFYEEFYYKSSDSSQDVVPVLIKSGIVFTGCHYGFDSVQGLIEKASYARRSIKNNFDEDYLVFDETLHERIIREKKIEACIPAAFENNEFYVAYQPKVLLATGRIVGAEALVRWNSSILGEVSPDSFLPILERNGGIIKLDFLVYRKVFEMLSSRYAEGLSVVPVSVNMSRSHIASSDFVQQFTDIFREFSIPASLIEVEILEQSVSQHNNRLKKIIDDLHVNGFKVSMDDFGAGESSLNMLDTIPVDTLKIDRNFLTESSDWDKTQRIIRKIVELARELKKSVVCEGVENRMQIDFLNSINCDIVQGFFYSRPLNTENFIDFLEKYI